MSPDRSSARDPEPWHAVAADRLRRHEWVQEARAIAGSPRDDEAAGLGPATIQVVPTPAGIDALRRRGKAGVAAVLGRHLRDSGVAIPPMANWQLLEELPGPGQQSGSRQACRDGMPIVSELALDAGATALTCRLQIPCDLPVFRGHFRHLPIVPGVTQVGWAVGLATAHGLVAGEFLGITSVKFRRLVQPGMRLAAQLWQDGDPRRLRFCFEVPGTIVTTGRLRFGAAHD